MSTLPDIQAQADTLTAIRRDLHAHPEIGFEETRTAGIVARLLRDWGVDEVHEGVGRTGVVGVIHGQPGNRSIGLRADMDALPMEEATGLPYASTVPGKFHGCGHDGHTTMLLGAARHLAETRNFAGKAVVIFQPAEEGLGGARAMLADGLFQRFPCDEVYGMHNNPMAAPGTLTIKPGPAMAGASFFDITVKGRGAHAGQPQNARDPILVASQLVQALQSVVSRNVRPIDPVVLSVTQVHSGSAYNVIPDKAVISGTVRFFSDAARDLIHDRMAKLCAGTAEAYEVEVGLDLRPVFDVLVNDPALSQAYLEAAADVVGDGARLTEELVTGSEDFADMLRAVPGAYLRIGHAGNVALHNPGFVFDDDLLPVGASIYARIIERRLAVK
ncbi:M20 aminoacylase family protein [Albidovulum sp.]|uniref:M20 aminoacylase family protein n=1 Tax=Albidovulum sp. TaxID=1872424 RepID=UPI0039B98193